MSVQEAEGVGGGADSRGGGQRCRRLRGSAAVAVQEAEGVGGGGARGRGVGSSAADANS